MENLQEIEIIQLKNPSLFYAREVGVALTQEKKEFLDMINSINHYFNNENLTLCHFMPREGEICIGRRVSDRQWFRVKVEGVFNRSKGTEGSCFLVDEGTTESIPLQWLRQARKEHLNIPFQVKKYCLYGVKPVNLKISTQDLTVRARPSDNWDISAVTFMQKHIDRSILVQYVQRFVDQDEFIHVELYLTSAKRERICLNEEFIRQEYAIRYDPDRETTVDDIDKEKLKRLFMSKMSRSSLSDTEDGRSRSSTFLNDSTSSSYSGDHKNEADLKELSNMLCSPVYLQGMGSKSLNVKSHSDVEHPRKPVTMAQLRQKSEKSTASSDTETFKRISNLSSLFPTSSSPTSPVCGEVKPKTVCRMPISSSLLSQSANAPPLRPLVPLNASVMSPTSVTPPRVTIPRNISPSSSQLCSSGHSSGSPRPLLGNLIDVLKTPPLSSSDNESRQSDSSIHTRKHNLNSDSAEIISERKKLSSSPDLKTLSTESCSEEKSEVKSPVNLNMHTKSGGLVTFESLMSGDQSVPVTRARLPKAASKKVSPAVTEDNDNSLTLNRQLIPALKRQSSSGTSSDEKSRTEGTKPILKKSPTSNQVPERSMVRFKDSEAQEDAIAKKSKMMGQLTGKRYCYCGMVLQCSGTIKVDISPLQTSSPETLTTHKMCHTPITLSAYDPKPPPPSASEGMRLLETLARRQDINKKMVVPSEGKLNTDGVLVHSRYPIKPVCSLKEAPLHPIIKQAFEMMDFPTPTVIQSYAWPGILRGSHVVSLSASRSGKTLAYLAPLLTDLLNPSAYAEIPLGNGPLAIILVPFWMKAQSVYDDIVSLLQGNSKPRVIVCYGGGEEDSQVIPLINGCDILVTTPRSLIRMIQKKATSLSRLCHIIIDDAEILLEMFMSEIQHLMTEYSTIIQENAHRSAPQQILLFGRQWCSIVDSFMDAFMADPILLITSGFEASVYGKIQQVPYLWKFDQQVSKFMDLMSSVATDKTKTIVFCVDVNTTLEVLKLLSSYSQYALHAHHNMDLLAIEQAAAEWSMDSDSAKILVCTDECIAEMKIVDATCVVHYELPASKTRFGNRLSCMSKYYWNSTERNKEPTSQPVSHIIVTEKSGTLVPSVIQLLKRSKSKIPRDLKNVEQGMLKEKESDMNKEFCLYIKAFGTCKYQSKCNMRHEILPKVDNVSSDLHLDIGEVKVFVTHIVDATHLFVRLLEHRTPDGDIKDLTDTKIKMQFQMFEWFSDLANRRKYSTLYLGDLCAVSDDGETFQRVKICDIIDNSPGSGIKVSYTIAYFHKTELSPIWVLFVDEGRKENINANKLYALPSQLRDIPYQATEVFICRVKPVDEDEDWTARASYFVYDFLYQKELDGRIVLSIGNTLWLDPLVERVYLKDTKTFSNHLYARSELLKNGFAVDNPSHLQNLYDACKNKIEIPDLNRQLYNCEKKMEVELLPESLEFHDVYLSAVDLPNLLFLQRKESIGRLETMNDEINERMKTAENVSSKTSSLKAGDVCLAKFQENDCWYRVRIMEVLEDGKLEVLYADFGDKETTTRDRLSHLPEEYMDLPFQAIECELAHINPRGEEWDAESGDLIWDLSHFVTGEKKILVAKVVSKGVPTYTGSHKYCVELYETSTADDVNIAIELIWSGYASPHENSNLHDLFLPPRPSQFYRVPIMKIQDLCCLIYWERDSDKAFLASKEILQIVKYTTKSAPLNLLGHNVVAAIIKLIGRNGNVDIHKHLLESVLVSAEASERLCEEIIDLDGCVGIIKCLEQNNRPWIQEQATSAISRLLSISTRFVPPFEDDHVIQVLCELLQSTEDLKVQIATCGALRDMCRASDRISEVTHEFVVCTGIIHCIEDSRDPTLIEAAMLLLDQLLDSDSSQNALTKEKLARTVVGVLEKQQTDTCVKCGVKFCINFAETSRKHKTILLQLKVISILSSIMNSSSISSGTKELGTKLKNSLVVKVQPSHSLTNHPVNPIQASEERSVLPMVSWSQDSFTTTLAIKVKGVKARSEPLTVTENSVNFRAIVENVLYKFDWELYNNIFPGKCRVSIKASEVLISLRKNEKGRWPRLLKSKNKPPNLSIDFERFIDSSDDDDQLDEDMPFRLKEKKVGGLNREGPRVRAADLDPYEIRQHSDSSNSDTLSEIDDIEHDPYNILGVRDT